MFARLTVLRVCGGVHGNGHISVVYTAAVTVNPKPVAGGRDEGGGLGGVRGGGPGGGELSSSGGMRPGQGLEGRALPLH